MASALQLFNFQQPVSGGCTGPNKKTEKKSNCTSDDDDDDSTFLQIKTITFEDVKDALHIDAQTVPTIHTKSDREVANPASPQLNEGMLILKRGCWILSFPSRFSIREFVV